MTTLTDGQIAALAASQGLTGRALVVSVAVALTESGGRTDALGPSTKWGRAVGVWQIMPLAGRPSTSQLMDANVNAQQMYKISSGGKNWGPWEAYTNGSYLRFWSRAQKAANNPSAVPPTSGSGVEQASLNPLDWAEGAGNFFKLMTDPNTWLRVGMVLGGGIILAIGLFMLTGQADRLGQAAGMAVDFIPGGKVLKGVKAAT